MYRQVVFRFETSVVDEARRTASFRKDRSANHFSVPDTDAKGCPSDRDGEAGSDILATRRSDRCTRRSERCSTGRERLPFASDPNETRGTGNS
jgi:hypothetical protein